MVIVFILSITIRQLRHFISRLQTIKKNVIISEVKLAIHLISHEEKYAWSLLDVISTDVICEVNSPMMITIDDTNS